MRVFATTSTVEIWALQTRSPHTIPVTCSVVAQIHSDCAKLKHSSEGYFIRR